MYNNSFYWLEVHRAAQKIESPSWRFSVIHIFNAKQDIIAKTSKNILVDSWHIIENDVAWTSLPLYWLGYSVNKMPSERLFLDYSSIYLSDYSSIILHSLFSCFTGIGCNRCSKNVVKLYTFLPLWFRFFCVRRPLSSRRSSALRSEQGCKPFSTPTDGNQV